MTSNEHLPDMNYRGADKKETKDNNEYPSWWPRNPFINKDHDPHQVWLFTSAQIYDALKKHLEL